MKLTLSKIPKVKNITFFVILLWPFLRYYFYYCCHHSSS